MTSASVLRKQLQITQQDMAMLLGITRVHYAMFESGRRSLPAPAMQRYAELQSGLASDIAKKISSPIDPQAIKDHLSRLLNENQYQREKVARQIVTGKEASKGTKPIETL